MHKKLRESFISYLFCFPTLVIFTIFIFIPLVWAFYLSFTECNILTFLTPTFVGFRNYLRIFSDPYYSQVFWNTIYFAILYVPPSLITGLILALLLERPFRGSSLVRLSLFVPNVVSLVVVSIVWTLILSSSPYGLANRFLAFFGIKPQGWLSDPKLAMISIAILMVWHSCGYNMLIYLAGLQSIPEEVYESATLDGATALRRIFHITLPLLKPTIIFLTITTIINAFQVFTPIYIMTSGGPGYSTTTIVNSIYTKGFLEFEMGVATALSIILFVVLLILTFVQRKISKEEFIL